MTKKELLFQREQLLYQVHEVNQQIRLIEHLEQPYVAAIAYQKGVSKLRFKNEQQAKRKFEQYCQKSTYQGSIVNGAYLYQQNEDGTMTLLQHQPIDMNDFYPFEFDKGVTAHA